MASAGRRSPLGPVGIAFQSVLRNHLVHLAQMGFPASNFLLGARCARFFKIFYGLCASRQDHTPIFLCRRKFGSGMILPPDLHQA